MSTNTVTKKHCYKCTRPQITSGQLMPVRGKDTEYYGSWM